MHFVHVPSICTSTETTLCRILHIKRRPNLFYLLVDKRRKNRRSLSICHSGEDNLTLKFMKTSNRVTQWRLATGQFFEDSRGFSKLSGLRRNVNSFRLWNDAISLSLTFHSIANGIMLFYNAERLTSPGWISICSLYKEISRKTTKPRASENTSLRRYDR